ncbi:GNAT family N-acetyltransferase [bacterium]|nr:GNAT family N-acetyltransferase [bacterium]
MATERWVFKNAYEFRFLEDLAADPGFQELVGALGGAPPWEELLVQEEREKHEALKSATKVLKQIHLGIYFEKRLIGFTRGFQTGGSNLHMAMSYVHQDHRRQGLYSELLRAVLEFSRFHGFQTVDSNHRSTNNPVLIAKLRAGFVISGMHLSDIMGCLVTLTYFHNAQRRELMDARSGLKRPEGKIRELFF